MDTAQKLDEAIGFIEHSREELKKDNLVILEGFQDEVGKICEQISALQPQDMLQFSDKLKKLTELMDELDKELRAHKDLIQQQVLHVNAREKALKSYTKVEHSDKKNGNN